MYLYNIGQGIATSIRLEETEWTDNLNILGILKSIFALIGQGIATSIRLEETECADNLNIHCNQQTKYPLQAEENLWHFFFIFALEYLYGRKYSLPLHPPNACRAT